MTSVTPIVLAAGESRRMGAPKPFLTIEGRTFISTILERLADAGLPPAIVVSNPNHADLYGAASLTIAKLVPNPRPRDGMISSLRLGFDALPATETHALVCLVDMPGIAANTYKQVAEFARQSPESIIIAAHKEKEGHPIVWPRTIFGALSRWEGRHGAQGFLKTVRDQVMRCVVDDPAILIDYDTPKDLEQRSHDPSLDASG